MYFLFVLVFGMSVVIFIVNSCKVEICVPEFPFLYCPGLEVIHAGHQRRLTSVVTDLLATLGSWATDPPVSAWSLSSNSQGPGLSISAVHGNSTSFSTDMGPWGQRWLESGYVFLVGASLSLLSSALSSGFSSQMPALLTYSNSAPPWDAEAIAFHRHLPQLL